MDWKYGESGIIKMFLEFQEKIIMEEDWWSSVLKEGCV